MCLKGQLGLKSCARVLEKDISIITPRHSCVFQVLHLHSARHLHRTWTPTPATLTGIRIPQSVTPRLGGQSGHLADPIQCTETPQEKEEHSYVRTQMGRLLFLSVLKPDLQYAVGQFETHASAPTVSDRIALKRLILFLSATRNMTLDLFSKGRLVLAAVVHADWAGLAERRSATGGVVLLAGCCVSSWYLTQASYALSSSEAELNSMASTAVEVPGIQAFLVEQGFAKEPPVVYGDSSSALQLANHTGTGRLKHVEVRLLAIRSWIADDRLRLMKVRCAENCRRADEGRIQRHVLEDMCAFETETEQSEFFGRHSRV